MMQAKVVNQVVEIEDLPINAHAKLTSDQRTPFVKMIRSQFEAKRSLYHAQSKIREAEILEQYRKKVGFSRLQSELLTAKVKVAQLRTRIEDLALSDGGERTRYCGGGQPRRQEAINKLDALFQAIEDNAPDVQLEDKLVSRMLLSTTHGEAVVILRSILGNELIPAITREQLALPAPASN